MRSIYKTGNIWYNKNTIETIKIDEKETIIKSYYLKDLSSEGIENLIKAVNKKT